MRIVYAPEGQSPQSFEIPDLYDLDGPECELIEEAGGTQWGTFGEWFDLFSRDGYRANKAFVWALLRRSNPDLGFEEMVHFKMSDVRVFASEDEVDEGKGESGPDDSVTGDAPMSSESPTPDSAA